MNSAERKKEIIIFFEILKRILLVAIALSVMATAFGWIDLPLARRQLMC